MIDNNEVSMFGEKSDNILSEISKDIVGQKDIVENSLIAIIAGGNILLEGVPGIGKTRLVRSIARALNLPFARIQFTPDLMPADVTGTNIIIKDENGSSKLSFQPGPIFSSIVLADEINRATPKTQSALLEAMQEHTVTVAGQTMKLMEPFFVMATQNPIEQDGTYALPEAQMDRFMMKVIVGNPSIEELKDIVKMTQITMEETSQPVINADELLRMRSIANNILVADDVMEYAIKLVASTNPTSQNASEAAKRYLKFGSSPRGAQALITSAKVRALIKGRYNVSYEDITSLAYPVLRHRIKMNFEAITKGINTDMIIGYIISELDGKKPRR